MEKCVLVFSFQRIAACQGESGWCSDGTSTPGAWKHAGVRFLLSGVRLSSNSSDQYADHPDCIAEALRAFTTMHNIEISHKHIFPEPIVKNMNNTMEKEKERTREIARQRSHCGLG
jgi:hypothetical protein